MYLKTRPVLLTVAAALITGPLLRADFLTISQPTSSYTSSTTLIDFTDDDNTLLGFLSAGGQTLYYGSLIQELTVPDSWTTWGSPPDTETATPRVGYTDGSSSLLIDFGKPVATFGFEAEPNNDGSETITADFYQGTHLVGTISRSPSGTAGALLYAATSFGNPFTSVLITNLTGDDFAIARQRYTLASVPEPATYGLAGISVLVLTAASLRMRRWNGQGR